ncbi:MAG: hypothetical protein AB1327_05970 [Bacillota bacterium]
MSVKKRRKLSAEGIRNIQADLEVINGAAPDTNEELANETTTRANSLAPRWLNRNRNRRIGRIY